MNNETPFIWHELVTPDQKISVEFYCKLLGWSIRTVDAGEYGIYTIFQKGNKDIAGMMDPIHEPLTGSAFWHAYIEVEDIDECVNNISDLGGQVIVETHLVEDVGKICKLLDPTGAPVYLMEPV